MELSSNKTDFNHIQSKNKYLGLLELYYSTSTFKDKRNSLHLVKDTFRKDYIVKNAIHKNNTRHEKYEVKDEGDDVVIVFKKKKEKPLEILSFENIYEILIKLHVDNNHKKMELKSATYLKYQIPDICFDLIPEACNVCKEEQSCASQTGIVTFIQKMALKSNAYYNALLIYVDQYTEFIIIRPMKSNDAEDIVTELFKIFMELGPPTTVHMCLNKMFRDISMIMNRLCPSCNILFDYNDDKDKITLRVFDALGDWMKEAHSNCWEIGCSIVQRKLNTRVRATLPETQTPVTAHDLFFKNPSIFDNVSDLSSRWSGIKPIETAVDFPEQSNTDLTFLCATQNEDLVEEGQDPLATNVSDLDIKDEPENQILSTLKINRQHIGDAIYCEAMKENPKPNNKKTRKKKRISHITLSDSEDEPLTIINNCDKDKNVVSSNKGFLSTLIINAHNDKKTIETLELIQDVKEGEKTVSDLVKMTNTKASTSGAGKERDEEDLHDDENIIIDFGAEESQVIDISIAYTKASTSATDKQRYEKQLYNNENIIIDFAGEESKKNETGEVNIANTKTLTNVSGKEKDEEDLHDDETIIIDFGAEEGQVIDIKIANAEAFTSAKEETNKEDLPDDDSIIDFGAEI